MTKAFEGYTLEQMQQNWKDIELFRFVDSGPRVLANRAYFNFPKSETTKQTIETVLGRFGGRMSLKFTSQILDDILYITYSNEGMTLSPVSQGWHQKEFDLTRELDQALRAEGVTAEVSDRFGNRAFFRGEVVKEK